jgi:hypothetical protein
MFADTEKDRAIKRSKAMSYRISRFYAVIVLAVLAVVVSPASSFARGRQPIRNLLQRPAVQAARANLQGVADQALASRGINLSVSQLSQFRPLRNRLQGGDPAAMQVADPAPSYATPSVQPTQSYAAPVSVQAPSYTPTVVTQSVAYQPTPAVAPVDDSQVPSTPKDVSAAGADLVLEDVKLFADATMVAGPAYSVRYRNQGVKPTAKFSVAVLASPDANLHEDSPRVVMKVNPLYPGEMQEIILRLPKCEFSHLIVMVDATEGVEELDESNNAAVLERASLAP